MITTALPLLNRCLNTRNKNLKPMNESGSWIADLQGHLFSINVSQHNLIYIV